MAIVFSVGMMITAAPQAAVASSRPDDVPPVVEFKPETFRFIGEGCKDAQSIIGGVTPDKRSLHIGYLHVDPVSTTPTPRKIDCWVIGRINISPGWQLEVTKLTLSGRTTIRGGSAEAKGQIAIAGPSGGRIVSAATPVMEQNVESRPFSVDSDPDASTGVSPCAEKIAFDLRVAATATGGSDVRAQIWLTHASATTYALRYQRCITQKG
ncbi:DUF4360 domain-containing protein [Pilimelia terevasa]|uniref:DUF4360 domain-containing protein n=1 Tax=Pilimelia terevasa TaxID=53372 RepID=UPI001669DAEB|nr:DUF4360 domain-containing protein [Pilimelia terevasa]